MNDIVDITSGYKALMDHLAQTGVCYRRIEHAPEGRTDRASEIRGHPLAHAAKCLVVEVRFPGAPLRYVNCVSPGHRRLDFVGLCRLLGGSSARMAPAGRAGELTGCPMGAVTPFSFHPDLILVADPELLEAPQLVFNAGRLDLSVALSPEDYQTAARPMFARIVA